MPKCGRSSLGVAVEARGGGIGKVDEASGDVGASYAFLGTVTERGGRGPAGLTRAALGSSLRAAKSRLPARAIPRSGEAPARSRLDTGRSLTTPPGARRGRSREAQGVAWRRILFVCTTGALAVAAAELATGGWHATPAQWAQFWLLATLAAAGVLATVRGREAAHDTAGVFLVAGAVVLPLGFAPFVALPACLVAAVWQRTPAFVFVQRAFAASLATVAAAAIAHATSNEATAGRAALLATAALAYCATARALDAGFARLSRSRRFRPQLGAGLATDVVLAALGVAVASLWTADPWRVPFALAPVVLVHRLQRLPTLEQQAGTDAKTGLMNMHVFGDALQAALATARVERRPLSLVVVDLDHLREINNEHGHLVGDAVIKGISQVLRQQIRKGDLAARFGGEEFVLALPDTPPDRALRLAERIREAVASHVFRGEPAGPASRATLSAGVASYPRDAATASALLHAADLAVMAAKARGRNRVVDAADLASSGRAARKIGRQAH
jgi:diguanylate cyclase (GGDEF)-like protein